MDFINAAQLPVCQMRPNCFGCTKEQMNSLSPACKEPGAWLSLSGRRKHYFLAQLLSGFHFVCPSPLSPSLPLSFDITGHPGQVIIPAQSQWLPIRLYTPCNGAFTAAHRYGTCPAGNEQLAKRWFPPSVGKLQVQHFLKHYLYLTKGNRK